MPRLFTQLYQRNENEYTSMDMRNIQTDTLDNYITSIMPNHTDEERQEAKANVTELVGIIAQIAQKSGSKGETMS